MPAQQRRHILPRAWRDLQPTQFFQFGLRLHCVGQASDEHIRLHLMVRLVGSRCAEMPERLEIIILEPQVAFLMTLPLEVLQRGFARLCLSPGEPTEAGAAFWPTPQASG